MPREAPGEVRARGRHRSGDADIAQFDNNLALLREGIPAAEPVMPSPGVAAALDRFLVLLEPALNEAIQAARKLALMEESEDQP